MESHRDTSLFQRKGVAAKTGRYPRGSLNGGSQKGTFAKYRCKNHLSTSSINDSIKCHSSFINASKLPSNVTTLPSNVTTFPSNVTKKLFKPHKGIQKKTLLSKGDNRKRMIPIKKDPQWNSK